MALTAGAKAKWLNIDSRQAHASCSEALLIRAIRVGPSTFLQNLGETISRDIRHWGESSAHKSAPERLFPGCRREPLARQGASIVTQSQFSNRFLVALLLGLVSPWLL